MNIVHFADLHIGVTANGKLDTDTGLNTRVMDCLYSLDVLIEYVRANRIDIVLCAGDVFHTNFPSPLHISELSYRISNLSKMCPLVIIPGNHDMAARRVSAVEYNRAIGLDNVFVLEEPSWQIINTSSGGLGVFGVPYPMKIHYGLTSNDPIALRQAVHGKLDEFGEIACGLSIPSVLMGHFSVTGAAWNLHKTVSVDDADVHMEHLIGCWNYVALGHLHIFQDLAKGLDLHPIVYPGSMERLDFGEEQNIPGFIHLTVKDSQQPANYIFVEHTKARRFLTLHYDICGMVDGTDFIIGDLERLRQTKRSIVRIIIEADSYTNLRQPAILSVLERKFYSVGSVIVNVKRKVRRVESENYAGLSSMNDVELLELYLKSISLTKKESNKVISEFIQL